MAVSPRTLNRLDRRFVGYAGELLACYELVKAGYEASLTGIPGSQVDLIADLRLASNRLVRVQVKACSGRSWKIRPNKQGYWQYRFKINKASSAELYAFVDVEENRIFWRYFSKPPKGHLNVEFGIGSFIRQAKGSLHEAISELGRSHE